MEEPTAIEELTIGKTDRTAYWLGQSDSKEHIHALVVDTIRHAAMCEGDALQGLTNAIETLIAVHREDAVKTGEIVRAK